MFRVDEYKPSFSGFLVFGVGFSGSRVEGLGKSSPHETVFIGRVIMGKCGGLLHIRILKGDWCTNETHADKNRGIPK